MELDSSLDFGMRAFGCSPSAVSACLVLGEGNIMLRFIQNMALGGLYIDFFFLFHVSVIY